MTSDIPSVTTQGVTTLPNEAWTQARHRTEVIRPLAALEVIRHEAINKVAQALSLSRQQVCVLIRYARQGTDPVADLTPDRSDGGRGEGRLPEPVGRTIRELLQKRFLTKQKRSLAAFHREVAQVYRTQKLPMSARNTVTQRVAELHPAKMARSRGGQGAARPLQGAGDIPSEVIIPLGQARIDHTVIDLIMVDEHDRQPIGRPCLTLAIDVLMCCVLGMMVTLEAPPAILVGLCLTHAVCDKWPQPEGLNVGMDQPISGRPGLLCPDNTTELKSKVLHRGCEQHGIRLDYYPPGQPYYGSIVEQIVGAAMQMIRDGLPGTTSSNPGQCGEYDSEKITTLTLRELEHQFALTVGAYHGPVHNDLLQPPTMRWAEITERVGVPATVIRSATFLVDFLPVIRHTLTRTGFIIDRVHYYASALKPWITRHERLPAFLIRRDPRDISRIWILESKGQHCLEIRYRTLSHPAATLWGQCQALIKSCRLGREQVDELALFHMIGQMRRIVTTAQKATRKT